MKSEIDAIRERFAKIDKKDDDALVENGDLVNMKVKRIDDVEPKRSATRLNTRSTRSSSAGARTNPPWTSMSAG